MIGQPRDDLYLNGEFMPLASGQISVQDRGFQFADGVYEVVRFKGSRFLWLDEHLARLERGLTALAIPGVGSRDRFTRVLPELVRRSGSGEGSIYLQVTRGPAPRDFSMPISAVPTELAYVAPQTFFTWDQVLAGTTACLMEDIRWTRCDIKAICLTAAVLGKAVAAERGASEVIWVGPDRLVREGGSCNLFVVRGGEVWTHPADRHILAGVTRLRVLEIARESGVVVREEPVTAEELLVADEVFLSSTLRDLLPILRVDGRPIGRGQAGPVSLRLAERMRAVVDRELSADG